MPILAGSSPQSPEGTGSSPMLIESLFLAEKVASYDSVTIKFLLCSFIC